MLRERPFIPMQTLSDARIRLFAGATLISFSPVFVTLAETSPTVSAFYRVLIGGCALTALWFGGAAPRRLDGRMLPALAAAAAFFALDLWFWHRSIGQIGAGRATLLANLQVFFMIAAGAVLLAEPPTRRQLLAAVLAFAGLAIMIGRDWLQPAASYRVGVVFGLLTAASYAGYLLSLRTARLRAGNAFPVRDVAVVSLLAAGLLGVASVAEGTSLAIVSAADVGWLAAYGLLSHAAGVVLIASSLGRVSPTGAGIALLVQPALSFVWEILFFGAVVTPVELVGASLTLAAIYLGSVRAGRRGPPAASSTGKT